MNWQYYRHTGRLDQKPRESNLGSPSPGSAPVVETAGMVHLRRETYEAPRTSIKLTPRHASADPSLQR